MTYDEAISRINKYILSDKNCSIIVDLPNARLYRELLTYFNVGKNKIKRASDYALKDGPLSLPALKAELESNDDILFLDGLTFYLKLEGEFLLKKELKSILEISSKGKIIILTFACHKWLRQLDNRLFSSARISIIEGEEEPEPILNFISPELPHPDIHINGIGGLDKVNTILEQGSNDIPIITEKRKSDYKNSILEIHEYITSYHVLYDRYPDIKCIPEISGSQAEWNWFLNEIDLFEDLYSYINQKFGNTDNLSQTIKIFDTFNRFEKWALFIALKIYGAKGNEYLTRVISKSETFKDFITNCFCEILQYTPNDKEFLKVYNERKSIVSNMLDYSSELSNYCKMVYSIGPHSLYYMTDLTQLEKEQTLALIDAYSDTLSESEIRSILCVTYPGLALYLEPFDTGNEELNKYIESYKYCKVINKITPEFMSKVDYQATAHEYIKWLKPRSVITEGLNKDKDKVILFFMDAMGIEYLSYMQNRCYENGLLFKVEIGRCDLPSITSINKYFVDEFKNCGCKVVSKKDLDNLKHEGNSSYNYENTKIPIHLVEELNILDRLIEELKKLENDQTAYIISDHGATRLAVINESECKWEVSEKGLHSGRCCPKSDISDKPDCAVEENDFWSLANYDRFKGGRKAIVEVHGGATIEEVAVPIITVHQQENITCKSKDEEPIIVSFKKKATLLIFVSLANCDEISISVNGRKYKALPSDTLYIYKVEMPDITKAGIYTYNVYKNDVLICKDLKFEIKKEGVSERKFF